MFGIEILAKLIKVLRSAGSPSQIAAGFVLGMIIGLTPLWSLHNLVIIIVIILVNVNISASIFSFVLFSAFAYLLDPAFHSLGYYLLTAIAVLRNFWTFLYNVPILSLSNFNNTVVMGSLIVSIILITPMYFLVKKGIIAYRENIDAKIQKWKIIQVVQSSKIYSWYMKLKNIGD